MAIEIIVPRLGWSMDEGIFGQWLKQEGEMVLEGDSLFELESDKATQDVESFDSGVLRLPAGAPQPGDTVKVGQCLGYLCSADEAAPATCSGGENVAAHSREDPEKGGRAEDHKAIDTSEQHSTQTRGDAARHEAGAGKESANDHFTNPPATPTARRLARKLGVEIGQVSHATNGHSVTQEDVLAAAEASHRKRSLGEGCSSSPACGRIAVSPRAAAKAAQLGIRLTQITGSGRGGRIRERDVLAAAQPHSKQATTQNISSKRTSANIVAANIVDGAPLASASTAKLIPSSSNRRTIAARMLAATQQTAQVTLMVKADATDLMKLREDFKQACASIEMPVPSVTSMFVKLVAVALQRHPEMLHQWADEGLLAADGVHMAVAIDTPRGLLAPVLRDVTSLPLGEVAKRLASTIEKARAGELAPEQLQGGTFTLSNLGRYAVDGFTPILNLPQSAILGIGRTRREPTVVGDDIVIRDQVTLSLTFDHRVHDGAPAAAFLQTFCEILTQPGPWLMQ